MPGKNSRFGISQRRRHKRAILDPANRATKYANDDESDSENHRNVYTPAGSKQGQRRIHTHKPKKRRQKGLLAIGKGFRRRHRCDNWATGILIHQDTSLQKTTRDSFRYWALGQLQRRVLPLGYPTKQLPLE